MMKHEFEKLAKVEVSPETYNEIELVYMHHPAIQSKQDIVNLYLMVNGMTIIKDMMPRAQKIGDLEEDLRLTRQKANEIMDIIEKTKEA